MFFGREYYLNRMRELLSKPTASVVTCRGRRRVGKSTLFEEFAKRNGCRFIKIEGLAPKADIKDRDQRAAFGSQLAIQSGLPELVPDSWLKAFHLLNSVIRDDDWTVVLLDEISWMGREAPTFPGDLKVAWDNYFKKHDKLILVLCGSVSRWITDNIVKSSGFLGRRSLNFVLPELPICDAVKFWGDRLDDMSTREILDTLAVTGCVPKYLEEMNLSIGVAENIRRTCFSPDGYLFEDFEDIFSRVFGKSALRKRSMLAALSSGPKTVSEISQTLGVERNGTLAAELKELDTAGFVAQDRGINPETGRPALEIKYRIKDCYTRFYLHYIEPVRERITKGLYTITSLDSMPGWDAMLGLQFETLVMNNFHSLLPALGLDRTNILSVGPYARRGKRGEGCQIDILFQTEFLAYAVEVKRMKNIDLSVIDDMKAKLSRFPRRENVTLRKALVYDGTLSPQVEERKYFDALIPARSLMAP
ncbi:MAG: ATP-binding protein [Kiritimatiellae bacterium]|nr:ATP-binding protein [Kiritimatiellia bacterium]